ncbi:MAG: MBL fold metallo-hydrolase [Synechococcaceae cyanobacterium SM2_3_60]|nr:MBL fold metallo-hydrolase [Synechococcaceae cyanobacterium SM2_3_60]
MQRRQFLRSATWAAGSLAGLTQLKSHAQEASVSITWLHHSCVFLEANDYRILINPFRTQGCTAGYPIPDVTADLVLLSSRLFDEGHIGDLRGNPRVLFEAGEYTIDGLRIQGISMAHDTFGGQRFGRNIAWRLTLGGIDMIHLGGAAAPITREESILLARPDLVFIPVGGGVKNYDAAGAVAAINELQPRVVIPTMFRTAAAAESCDLSGVDAFLSQVRNVQALGSRQLSLGREQVPAEPYQVLVFPENG